MLSICCPKVDDEREDKTTQGRKVVALRTGTEFYIFLACKLVEESFKNWLPKESGSEMVLKQVAACTCGGICALRRSPENGLPWPAHGLQ